MERHGSDFVSTYARLQSCRTFAAYSDCELRAVLAFAVRLSAERGQVLVEQGEPNDAVFVLLEGAAKLLRRTRLSGSRVTALLDRGSSYGESALFSPRGSPLAMVALSPCDLLGIPAGPFKRFLGKHRELMWSLASEIARRLDGALAEREILTTYSAPQKVAAFLLSRASNAARNPVPIEHCPRLEIASLLNIRPETLSRTIRGFERHKWIEIENDGIVLTDARSLTRVLGYSPTH